ncbi:GAF domain-containing protein [Pedobacter sp. AW31-3R]|uniref:GAF domain-containing protein n=1 Tax=Pedobacter sp. AW31-3R TaxID=3445781 RepID=UPI003F9EF0D3
MTNYKMPESLIPENEEERIQELHRYEITETPAEADFETIALLASETFETEGAFINFVDKAHVFSKANTSSLLPKHSDRAHSLCALTILGDGVTVFHDTHEIQEFAATPFISVDGIRFYAAVPLKTAAGYVIGTLGVTDNVPHLSISERQVNVLRHLSDLVMEKLEVRLNHTTILRNDEDTLHRLVHDMRSPITSITLYAQLLGAKEMNAEKVMTMAGRIEKSAKDIEGKLLQLFKKDS